MKMKPMDSSQLRIVANADIMTDGISRIEAVLATLDLPALAGSVKQIEWATQIRAHAIHSAVREMLIGAPKGQKNAYANQAANMVVQHSTSAAWWIDHRNKADGILHYLKALASK